MISHCVIIINNNLKHIWKYTKKEKIIIFFSTTKHYFSNISLSPFSLTPNIYYYDAGRTFAHAVGNGHIILIADEFRLSEY